MKEKKVQVVIFDAPTPVRELNPPGHDLRGGFPPGSKSSGGNNPPGCPILLGMFSQG